MKCSSYFADDPKGLEKEEAKKQSEKLTEFFEEGKAHFDKGCYEEALDYFYKVCGIAGNYQGEVFEFIARAEELLKKEETPSMEEYKDHFKEVVGSLLDGKVVFFLGLGINSEQRPPNAKWQSKHKYLYSPSYQELATYLAGKDIESNINLARAAQEFLANRKHKPNTLHNQLDKIYKQSYSSRPIHHLLVNLSKQLDEKAFEPKHPIIFTTNYDCVLEQAFVGAKKSFDLLYTLPLKEHGGKFAHVCFDSKEGWSDTNIIDKPNKYLLKPYEKPLIIKVNGMTNHHIITEEGKEESSYIITEDYHLDNLAYGGIAEQIPSPVLAELKQNGFLSLGMDLRNWSVRNIFRRIWGDQVDYSSWVIQADIEAEEEKFWNPYDVDIINLKLNRYIASLIEEINKLPKADAV